MTAKYDKPDEPHPVLGPGYWTCFETDLPPRVYFRTEQQHWFTDSAGTIANVHLGYALEAGKVRNLLSLSDGDIGLWYFLALLPEEQRKTLGDEFVNFILGPLAAALKVQGLGFDERSKVIKAGALIMLFEAMSLDLVPKGSRKNLYEALITRFNAECPADPDEVDVRLTFYTILADVLAPIFDEAGADELVAMIDKVLADNPKQAGQAKEDPKVVGWIMGQVMRSSPTKLDPNTVRAAILERL